MRLARYIGNGEVAITHEEAPTCPPGGILVRTEACGLCSGELMSWYMDKKIPHVIGHEMAGIVEESQDERFPLGARVFAHHHAPCGECRWCQLGRYVHCDTWKKTKLIPGGMAEVFGVPAANLADTLVVDALRPQDAALIEPLACVAKSIRLAKRIHSGGTSAVIGLGVMGLLHMFALEKESPIGFDFNSSRREWAASKGLTAVDPTDGVPENAFSVVYVCPGSQAAFDSAIRMAEPEGVVVMFAPLGPGEDLKIPQSVYFKDLQIVNSYSCGPNDTAVAAEWLAEGRVTAEQVVSHFIGIDDLPPMYVEMKAGRILKPMVLFSQNS